MDSKSKKQQSKRRRLSGNERDVIFQKTGGLCHICGGRLGKRWVADHVKPVAQGGSNVVGNFLPACWGCNRRKWHREPEALRFIMKLGIYCNQEIEHDSQLGKEIRRMYERKSAHAEKRRKR